MANPGYAFAVYAYDSEADLEINIFGSDSEDEFPAKYAFIYDPDPREELITLEIPIDIKPGSDPNSINCKRFEKEFVTVAVLTTETFDATTIHPLTVSFEGANEIHSDGRTGEPSLHQEDVDGDGDIDVVFHFRLNATGLDCGSTEGTLVGEANEGLAIEGTDSVRMVD